MMLSESAVSLHGHRGSLRAVAVANLKTQSQWLFLIQGLTARLINALARKLSARY